MYKDDLTEREQQILEFVLEGLSNREIAERLMITHHTSKAHVSSILHKLGAKTRAAAVRITLEKKYGIK